MPPFTLEGGHIETILRRLKELRIMMEKPECDPLAKTLPHRSYWVEPGRVLAGFYPGSLDPKQSRTNVRQILEAGIRTFIDLTERDEIFYGKRLRSYQEDLHSIAIELGCDGEIGHRRLPIRDLQVPDQEHMREILIQVERSLLGNRPVYVHCLGGKGRTGTTIGCYLIESGQCKPEEALGRIQQLRARRELPNDSPETCQQKAFVRSWRPDPNRAIFARHRETPG